MDRLYHKTDENNDDDLVDEDDYVDDYEDDAYNEQSKCAF